MLMSAVYKPRGSFIPNVDFGDDAPTVGFSQEDFTDRYNTELTEDEEARFQTWAKANNRLGDLYDYDMRGAWKAGAQQSDDGHFPDTFKKPNHPTFSVESKYSSDELKGGEWKEVNGKRVFRPGHELSESEATYLKKYFNDRERGVRLDVSGLVRSDAFKRKQFVQSVFANPNEPSLFEGFTDAWRAIPASVLATVSAGIDAMSIIPGEYMATTDEAKAWLKGMSSNMNETAQNIREYKDLNFGVNSYRAGAATQVIHGLIETLPKAALYSTGLGLTAGALAFGAEYGINRAQELKAQGVDSKTATVAGVASFLGGAVGLRLPPALGPNRIMSAIYGGLTNAGVMGAELQTINWVLRNQNYDALAKSYQLNMTDTLVATGLGAFMGGAFYRSPAQIRADQFFKHRAELTNQWTDQLMAMKNEDGTQKFTLEEARKQAFLGANSVTSFCNQYGLTPKEFWAKKPEVSFDENGHININIKGDDASVQEGFDRINEYLQRAYNGSPYIFDKFSLAHVGTGEGAQSHGWGLYFALAKRAANEYRIALAGAKYTDGVVDLVDMAHKLELKHEYDKADIINQFLLKQDTESIKPAEGESTEAYDWFMKEIYPKVKGEGAVYTVDIPDDNVMLREELSINQQPSYIRNAVRSYIRDFVKRNGRLDAGERILMDMRTDEFLDEMAYNEAGYTKLEQREEMDMNFEDAYKNKEAVSRGLSKFGVKGVRYNDAKDGECAVVFDDTAIKILDDIEGGEYFSRTVTRSSSPRSFNDYIDNGFYHNDQRSLSISKTQGRNLDSLNAQERKAFDSYMVSVPKTEAKRIQTNLSKFKDTPWGAQALESIFVRQAIKEIQAGRVPAFQSVLDHPDATAFRKAIMGGDEGIMRYLERTNIIGHPSKVEAAVNASFLNCNPSLDCAKFCYASDSMLYKGKNSVIKSELIDMMVKSHPEWAAKQIAREYPDFLKKTKALRLFDKGDGDMQWMPLIHALNKEGIRVAIFSKRPDFLRLVDDKNVRLLSIDDTNMALFSKNKDLPVAFVYQGERSLPNLMKVVKNGRIGVILPVQLGKSKAAKELNAKNVDHLIGELTKDPKTAEAAKRICGYDSGRSPDWWTCRHCDNKGGAGCYLKQTTESVIQFFNPKKKVSIENVFSEVELLKELLDNEQRGIATTNEQLGNLGVLRRKSARGDSNATSGVRVDGSVQQGNADRLARIRSVLSEDIRFIKERLDAIAETADIDYAREPHQGSSSVPQGNVRGQEGVSRGQSARDAGLQRANGQDGESYKQAVGDDLYGGKFSSKKNRVTLTPYANLSTFSHEMGHWYLEQTFDLFASGNTNALLQQDVKTLLNALGLKSIDEWNALSPEAKTKAHETFADWVEQYLAEGKVKDPSMAGVMKRVADWIVGVYQSVLGKDVEAGKAIAERHKAQFNEDLPALSPEVRSILDRLYSDQLRAERHRLRPTNEQTAAARTMLAHRQNELRTNAFAEGGATSAERAETQRQGLIAQQTAIAQMLAGENVDVSSAVSNMALSEGAVGNADSNFGKGFVLGADSDNSTIVVLQNRNRSDSVVSTIQINDIASKPQYGLTSFSRDTTQGAPIVSYGHLPDDAQLGRQDYVIDNGERIPVQYAVMEAGDLQTSNVATGANNPRYGQSADDTQVVAGNGRVIGLRESYRRGTGKQYQADMAADTATHGIKPEVIQGMQSPILVRIMPTEKVSTDFVKRSNRSNVMGMDVLEKARQDAPLIRTRMSEYTFNEDGTPTTDTAMKFIRDVGEITELKNLLTDDGRVKDSASKRINAAVFYEAYRSDALTKLFDDPDVNIKRVLNAMTALAPKVIQIREASKGAINLANPFVEGANAVRTARKEGTLGKDTGEQGGLFSSGAELPFSSVFTQNANSEGAILRMLNPLLDWTNQRISASNDPMFSTGAIDLADVAQELRRLQNLQRKANGQSELPDVDVEGIRGSLEKAHEIVESVQKEMQMKDPNAVAQAQAHAQAALETKSEVDIEFNDLLAGRPDSVIALGDGQSKTVSEIQQEIQSIQEQARTDSLAIGEAMVCILRNRGI